MRVPFLYIDTPKKETPSPLAGDPVQTQVCKIFFIIFCYKSVVYLQQQNTYIGYPVNTARFFKIFFNEIKALRGIRCIRCLFNLFLK